VINDAPEEIKTGDIGMMTRFFVGNNVFGENVEIEFVPGCDHPGFAASL
jgi:hypothetical protein